MQLSNQVDAQSVKRFNDYKGYYNWNVASALEWDLTAQMVWCWYCAPQREHYSKRQS